MAKIGKITGYNMVKKIGKNQKSDQGWEISEKDDILKVEEKKYPLLEIRLKEAL